MSFALRRTQALRLLEHTLEMGMFDRDRLAEELVIPTPVRDRIIAAEIPIPLDRQLLLALLVIAQAPARSAASRMAHRLRGQVLAALAGRSPPATARATAET